MIKLLASDYDGTLLQNARISKEDLVAINHFRNQGNLFGIITGRSISMIKSDLEEYNIPFDFLVCNNGGILCDDKLNIIRRHDIDMEIVDQFMERFGRQNETMFGIGDGDAFARVAEAKVVMPANFVPPKNVKNVPYEQILASRTINAMLLRAYDVEMTTALKKKVEIEYEGKVSFHLNNGTLDVNATSASKKKAIYELGEHFETKRLYVVGDGFNDLEMIEEFNGYALENAVDIVKKKAKCIVPSVAACIEMLEMEK